MIDDVEKRETERRQPPETIVIRFQRVSRAGAMGMVKGDLICSPGKV